MHKAPCCPNRCATQFTVPPKSTCHPHHCTVGPAWERTPKPLCVSGHVHAHRLPKHRMKMVAKQNPPATPQKPAVHPTPGFHQPELGACEAAGHAGDGAGRSAGTRSLSSGPAAGAPLRSPQPRLRPRTGRPPRCPSHLYKNPGAGRKWRGGVAPAALPSAPPAAPFSSFSCSEPGAAASCEGCRAWMGRRGELISLESPEFGQNIPTLWGVINPSPAPERLQRLRCARGLSVQLGAKPGVETRKKE